MTDTKPTPCCGYADTGAIKWNEFNGVVQCHNCGHIYELAAIKSQPVPVEPDVVKLLSEQDYEYNRKTNALIKRHAEQIDSLQSALKVAQQDKERLYKLNVDCEALIIRQREERKKVEERNKRMVELLKAFLGALKHPVPPTQKQWDAIGNLSSELLREVGK